MSTGSREDPRPDAAASPDRIDADFRDFEELSRIGSGGTADVTKVAHEGRGPDVCALKQPRMQGTLDSSAVSDFTAEAETWGKLDDHDHIVAVLDHDTEPLPWIALEYMDGGHLGDRLGDLDPAEALWVGVCVSRAVRHAHRRGIAHLDLKPENVLFAETGRGTWDVPKVADWGLAKMLLDHSQSVEGLSPQYAAPEQFDAEEFGPPDDFTDIYATGAVVYAALVGEPPFTGGAAAVMRDVLQAEPTPPSERVDGLPEGVDDVVMRALAKDKDDRYESILDLRRDLESLVERAVDGGTAAVSATSNATTAGLPTGTTERSTPTTDGPTQSAPGSTGAETGTAKSRETVQSGKQAQGTAESDADSGWVEPNQYMYGSILVMFLGGAAGSGLGGLLVLAGLVGFFYYWNRDMVWIRERPDLEWSPRRYLYLVSGFFCGITWLVYLYRRRKVLGLW